MEDIDEAVVVALGLLPLVIVGILILRQQGSQFPVDICSPVVFIFSISFKLDSCF
jgi:hypothetical protein